MKKMLRIQRNLKQLIIRAQRPFNIHVLILVFIPDLLLDSFLFQVFRVKILVLILFLVTVSISILVPVLLLVHLQYVTAGSDVIPYTAATAFSSSSKCCSAERDKHQKHSNDDEIFDHVDFPFYVKCQEIDNNYTFFSGIFPYFFMLWISSAVFLDFHQPTDHLVLDNILRMRNISNNNNIYER